MWLYLAKPPEEQLPAKKTEKYLQYRLTFNGVGASVLEWERFAAGTFPMSGGETTQIRGWVERYRAGDDSALNELLAHFEARLIGLTRKMLRAFPTVGRWEQTDDVYQEAAMRLRRALREVTPGSTREFFGLAALQIRRELINMADINRHRLTPSRVGQYGSQDGVSDSVQSRESVDDGEGLVELDTWTEFHDAAAALPDELHEVFHLIWYDGLGQAEAALILGVSLRTVGSRWQKARLTIHRALGGRLPGT
jgi:RNA polymerase sigma-70 factor (ECF subfamily)